MYSPKSLYKYIKVIKSYNILLQTSGLKTEKKSIRIKNKLYFYKRESSKHFIHHPGESNKKKKNKYISLEKRDTILCCPVAYL